MAQPLVELLYQAWADLDHAIEGLSAADAEARHHGLSRVAWTVGHVGQEVDSWFNVRFAGRAPHPLLSGPMFRTGANGKAPPWHEVLAAVSEVREPARRFLDAAGAEDMERVVPYTGGLEYLREPGLRLSYALMRTATHHFEHVGEVLTIRSLLGHSVDDNWVWGERLI
jgi:hypothetical protein